MSRPSVTLYSMQRRVKKPQGFDFAAYLARLRATERQPQQPCHQQANRCSGCPTPKHGELCWVLRAKEE